MYLHLAKPTGISSPRTRSRIISTIASENSGLKKYGRAVDELRPPTNRHEIKKLAGIREWAFRSIKSPEDLRRLSEIDELLSEKRIDEEPTNKWDIKGLEEAWILGHFNCHSTAYGILNRLVKKEGRNRRRVFEDFCNRLSYYINGANFEGTKIEDKPAIQRNASLIRDYIHKRDPQYILSQRECNFITAGSTLLAAAALFHLIV